MDLTFFIVSATTQNLPSNFVGNNMHETTRHGKRAVRKRTRAKLCIRLRRLENHDWNTDHGAHLEMMVPKIDPSRISSTSMTRTNTSDTTEKDVYTKRNTAI
ncbi:hypothetical protein PoB_002698500 [Plakobranchus ocellatus]|uniref:Uncharacterized protein n=1 Tax=Plakobranchus ocellatus TaxID=259542 RepID=A0AAV4A0N8_9GAST|nr:hypothetical protein PoB_002698500 [Plakobranchus ocellatus]